MGRIRTNKENADEYTLVLWIFSLQTLPCQVVKGLVFCFFVWVVPTRISNKYTHSSLG